MDYNNFKKAKGVLMQGTIKFYKMDKGYGFIAGDDGKDYYFHISDVVDRIPEVTMKGTPVRFTPLETRRGIMGKEITALEEIINKESAEHLRQIDRTLQQKFLYRITLLGSLSIILLSFAGLLFHRFTSVHLTTSLLVMLIALTNLYLLIKREKI